MQGKFLIRWPSKAEEEYEKYRVQRDKEYLSDFDRELVRYLKGE